MVRLVRRAWISFVLVQSALYIGACGQGEKNGASAPVTVMSTAETAALPSNHPCEYLSDRTLSALMKVKMTSTVVEPETSGTPDPVCAYTNIETVTTVIIREIDDSDYAKDVCTGFPAATIEYRDGIVGCAFDEKAYLVPGDHNFALEISYPNLKPQYQPGRNFGHLVGMEMVPNL